MRLSYTHTTVLDLNNLTSVLERELNVEFNKDRAITISMFMSRKIAEGHEFSAYQTSLWKQLNSRMIGDICD